MTTAILTFSEQGAAIAEKLAEGLGDCRLYVHRTVKRKTSAMRFDSIMKLAGTLFQEYRQLVFVAPCGMVVRAIAPHLRHKTIDPAVVLVDAGGRYAVSLLSGHEGGANRLAVQVANVIGADPVISTTTEAVKNVIIGIGCRRGVEASAIVTAIRKALRQAKVKLSQVRLLASASIKSDEAGLLQAAKKLGLEIRFIAADEIRSTTRQFRRSAFVASKVNLPAVSEPAALLAGRRTQLLLPKTIFHQVTIAIARENCSW